MVFILCWLFLLTPPYSIAQVADTSIAKKDFIKESQPINQFKKIYGLLLDSNFLLQSKGLPQSLAVSIKKTASNQAFFYLMASLLFFLGFLRTIFSRYFSTLYRVFFNTSLRQNQLTDQLEQAALPSLLFNVFFVLSAGIYIYCLQQYFNGTTQKINWNLLWICVATIAFIYIIKYVSLLFTGWVTHYKAEAKMYVFIVFLFNKVIGLFLVPFTLLMAFSSKNVGGYAIFISFLLLSILLLIRYFRAYSLLQHKIKMNGFHFFIYILALELLPIALIYKSILIYMEEIM